MAKTRARLKRPLHEVLLTLDAALGLRLVRVLAAPLLIVQSSSAEPIDNASLDDARPAF